MDTSLLCVLHPIHVKKDGNKLKESVQMTYDKCNRCKHVMHTKKRMEQKNHMTKPLMINILCNKTHIKPHIQLSLVNLAGIHAAPVPPGEFPLLGAGLESH